jgi:hypothetical protein
MLHRAKGVLATPQSSKACSTGPLENHEKPASKACWGVSGWVGVAISGGPIAECTVPFAVALAPWKRCTRCNGRLDSVAKHQFANRLQSRTRSATTWRHDAPQPRVGGSQDRRQARLRVTAAGLDGHPRVCDADVAARSRSIAADRGGHVGILGGGSAGPRAVGRVVAAVLLSCTGCKVDQ